MQFSDSAVHFCELFCSPGNFCPITTAELYHTRVGRTNFRPFKKRNHSELIWVCEHQPRKPSLISSITGSGKRHPRARKPLAAVIIGCIPIRFDVHQSAVYPTTLKCLIHQQSITISNSRYNIKPTGADYKK